LHISKIKAAANLVGDA